MLAQKTGVRRLRADETRARVFFAARELFAERGYQSATVSEIARRAGVAKGTFFVHFANKDAVIVALIELQVGDAERAHAQALESGGTEIDALERAIVKLAEHAAINRSLSRSVFAAMYSSSRTGDQVNTIFDRLRDRLTDGVRRAQDTSLIAKGPSPESIATSLLSLYYGASLRFTSDENGPDIETHMRELLALNLPHFLTPKGKRLWNAP